MRDTSALLSIYNAKRHHHNHQQISHCLPLFLRRKRQLLSVRLVLACLLLVTLGLCIRTSFIFSSLNSPLLDLSSSSSSSSSYSSSHPLSSKLTSPPSAAPAPAAAAAAAGVAVSEQHLKYFNDNRKASPLSSTSSFTATATTTSPSSSSGLHRHGKLNIAIALKTGVGVVANRVPIQLTTYLKDYFEENDQFLIIGDGPGRISTYTAHDVVTGTLKFVERQREREAEKLAAERGNTASASSSDTASSTSLSSSPNTHQSEQPQPSPSSFPPSSRLSRRSGANLPLVESSGTKNKGWKDDAHKNLPGFRLLFQRFPDADWYLMLDDDTYMFMENLRLYLRDFNPDLPFYIGNPSVFKGCDGIRKFGDGPQFAHGGSGILLSRAAIKAMLNIVDECVVKYSDCYWGDVRTGLCLRDAGILLHSTANDFHNFNKEPPVFEPTSEFKWPMVACQLPNSFHHLNPAHFQEAYTAEMIKDPSDFPPSSPFHQGWSASPAIVEPNDISSPAYTQLSSSYNISRLTTYMDLFISMHPEYLSSDNYVSLSNLAIPLSQATDIIHVIEDRDMPGHDYRHVEILDGNHVKGDPVRRASIETCFKVCASDVKCLAWTIDTDNLCWLKDGLGKSKTRKGVATGVLWSRKRCGVDEMVVPSSHHWNKLVPKLLPHYKDA